MSFQIMTDTSANLPTEYLQEENISIVAFTYLVNGKEGNCLDTRRFNGKRFYDLIRSGARVMTSQVSPQQYRDKMELFARRKEPLLYIGMSSGISGSFHCAELAACELQEEYPEWEIQLVDTLGASLGEGLLVKRAAELRRDGLSAAEAARLLNEQRQRICQVFTVDDLMYLRKGGRLSNVAAVVGTMLRIKPLLKGNEDGKIVAFGKCRGRKHAIEALADCYERLVCDPQNQTVGIAHADCPEDAAYLISLLNRKFKPKDILNVCYEPVTGSHVGPSALALFFEAAKGVRANT